jgi:23S rRNA (adenine1618-N6)-methyltransferase
MKSKIRPEVLEKDNLHPRNLHRSRYDFKSLIKACPELASFVSVNKYGNESIDFANSNAVKFLNKAILRHSYRINYWDIPADFLCPPIPGRADYIHYLADLLSINGEIPTGASVRGLDIGTGANCIYPIIGHQTYGWSFVATDVNVKALASAQLIIEKNQELTESVSFRLQKTSSDIFNGIVQPGEKFDFTMCNPPFHASLAEARAGTQRKWQNLGNNKSDQKKTLNFGGQHAELWYPGGEQAFITKMIDQSKLIPTQSLWFTSLVSKKTTLPSLYHCLKKVKAVEVKTIEMSQGQKVSRILAWTFIDQEARKLWRK